MKLRRNDQSSNGVNVPIDHHAHLKRHKKKGLLLKLGLGVLVLMIVGIAAYLAIVYRQSTQSSEQATKTLQETLQVKEANNQPNYIRSDFGFELKYDTSLLYEQAFTRDGNNTDSFAEDEATDTTNKYALVFLSVKKPEATQDVASKEFDVRTSELRAITHIRANFFETQRAKNKGLTDVQITQKHFHVKPAKNEKEKQVGQETVTIEGKEYVRTAYTYTNTQYGITTADGGRVEYATVQNGRPYHFSIRYYEFTPQENVALLQKIVDTATYFEPTEGTVLGVSTVGDNELEQMRAQAVLAETTDEEALPEDSANVPNELSDGTALQVVAKNQLTVLRVGATNCRDLELLLPNNKTGLKIDNACMSNIGSGAFVSADGYISTNGHVVKYNDADLMLGWLIQASEERNDKAFSDFLNYIIDARIVSVANLQQLISAAQAGDQQALQKLNQLPRLIPQKLVKTSDSFNQYAVQLSDEPLRVDQSGERPAFNFGEEIIEAQYVDSDFDENSGREDGLYDVLNSKSSDVAVLKVDKQTPFVHIGSIDSLKNGSLITAMGFPGFVDDGLETTQMRTVPSITQGTVQQIVFDSPEKVRKLIRTNVPIAGGNSGGPVVNDQGQMIGLATYGLRVDPTADGWDTASIMRDVADYKALLTKNNISLNENSEVGTIWQEAIDEFATAQYKSAYEKFKQVEGLYPAHYLPKQFAQVAESKIGTEEDQTPKQQTVVGGFVVLAVLAVVSVVVVVVIVRHHKKGEYLRALAATQPQPQPAAPMPAQNFATPTPPQPAAPSGPTPENAVAQPSQPPLQTTNAPAAPTGVPLPPQPVSTVRPDIAPPRATMPRPAPRPVQPVAPPAPQPTQPSPAPQVVEPTVPAPHTVIEPDGQSVEVQIPHDQA